MSRPVSPAQAGGANMPGPILEVPMDEMKDMFEMNVWGLLEVTRSYLSPGSAGPADVPNIVF